MYFEVMSTTQKKKTCGLGIVKTIVNLPFSKMITAFQMSRKLGHTPARQWHSEGGGGA